MPEEKSGMSGYENNMALALAEESDEEAPDKIVNASEAEMQIPKYIEQLERLQALKKRLEQRSEELENEPLVPISPFNIGGGTFCELPASKKIQEGQRQNFLKMIKAKQREEALKTVSISALVKELSSRKGLVDTVQILPDEEVTIMKRPKGARCWKTILEQDGCLTILYTED